MNRNGATQGWRGTVELPSRYYFVANGVLRLLLSFFEGRRVSYRGRGRLFRGRNQLLQRAASFIGECQEAVMERRVRMRQNAGCGVGKTTHVVAFHGHAFPVTHVRDTGLDVLRRGDPERQQTERCGQSLKPAS